MIIFLLIPVLAIPQSTDNKNYYYDKFVAKLSNSELIYRDNLVTLDSYIVQRIALDLTETKLLIDGNPVDISEKEITIDSTLQFFSNSSDKPNFLVVLNRDLSTTLGLNTKIQRPIIAFDVNDWQWDPDLWQDFLVAIDFPKDSVPNKLFDHSISRLLEMNQLQNYDDIFRYNEIYSRALSENPLDPELHRNAAILLGLMAWQEGHHDFSNRLEYLNRITPHLAIARYLNEDIVEDPNYIFARVLLLSLVGRHAEVLESLDKIPNEENFVSWKRVLELRARGYDYRISEEWKDPRMLEQFEILRATLNVASDTDKEEVVSNSSLFYDNHLYAARMLYDQASTVGLGHMTRRYGFRAEAEFLSNLLEVYEIDSQNQEKVIQFLNTRPVGLVDFTGITEHRLHVISPGLWADQYQRHFMKLLAEDFNFNYSKLGIPDVWSKIKEEYTKEYSDYLYFPFLNTYFESFKSLKGSSYNSYHIYDISHHMPELIPPGHQLFISKEMHPSIKKVLFFLVGFSSDAPVYGTAYLAEQFMSEHDDNYALRKEKVWENIVDIAPFDPFVRVHRVVRALEDASIDDFEEMISEFDEFDLQSLNKINNEIANTERNDLKEIIEEKIQNLDFGAGLEEFQNRFMN